MAGWQYQEAKMESWLEDAIPVLGADSTPQVGGERGTDFRLAPVLSFFSS
jgi:hypothetical protein